MGRVFGELSSARCLWLWCLVICYSHDIAIFPVSYYVLKFRAKYHHASTIPRCGLGHLITALQKGWCALFLATVCSVAQTSSYSMLQNQ